MPVGQTMRFLDPNILRSLANIELAARMLVEGMYASRHRCPFYGFSVEFVDHREYSPGDDPRLIDWKTLARTEKYFVKRFEMESNMDVTCIVDTSGSMSYNPPDANRLTKLEYANYMAASLCYLVAKQQDSTGLVTFAEEIRDFIPPRQGQRHLFTLLARIEEIEAGGETNIAWVLKQVADRFRRRGIMILISDCYGEDVIEGIRQLQARGQDIIVFHLLDHDEITLPFKALTSFRDMETGREIMGDPLRQRRSYLERMDNFCTEIREGCAACGADYRLVDTNEPIELVLRDYLLYRRQRAK